MWLMFFVYLFFFLNLCRQGKLDFLTFDNFNENINVCGWNIPQRKLNVLFFVKIIVLDGWYFLCVSLGIIQGRDESKSFYFPVCFVCIAGIINSHFLSSWHFILPTFRLILTLIIHFFFHLKKFHIHLNIQSFTFKCQINISIIISDDLKLNVHICILSTWNILPVYLPLEYAYCSWCL